MNNLMAFKEFLAERLRAIENLPEATGENHDVKSNSYPLSRNLESYYKKLPKLKSTLRDNLRILDIGAGKCKALEDLRNLFNGGDYYGTGIEKLDPCPVLIKNLACFASDLPFDNEYFDLVLTVHGLSWELQQMQAIDEIVRVLKPDGIALLYFSPFEYSVEHKLGVDFWTEANFAKKECLGLTFNEVDVLKMKFVDVFRRPMKHPFNEYEHDFYLEVRRA